MNKSNLKWLFLIIFLINSLCILKWGDTGLNAMREQIKIQNKLENNINELLAINRDLNRELDSYRSDSETIMIQARDLGYINENEKILFINNLSIKPKVNNPGDIILPNMHFNSIEKGLRVITIILMVLVLFLVIFQNWIGKTQKS